MTGLGCVRGGGASRAAKPDVPAAASRVSAAVMFSCVNKRNSFLHLKTNGRHRQLRTAAPPPGPDAEGPRRVEAVCSVTREHRAVTTDPSCCGSHRKERCLTRARTMRPPERFFKTNKQKDDYKPETRSGAFCFPGEAAGPRGAQRPWRARGTGSHGGVRMLGTCARKLPGPGTWWGRLLSWGPKPAPHRPGPSQDESSRVLRGSPRASQPPSATGARSALCGSPAGWVPRFPGNGVFMQTGSEGPPSPMGK